MINHIKNGSIALSLLASTILPIHATYASDKVTVIGQKLSITGKQLHNQIKDTKIADVWCLGGYYFGDSCPGGYEIPTPVNESPPAYDYGENLKGGLHFTPDIKTLAIQDSDLEYNCKSVYGESAYMFDNGGNNDYFRCKALLDGTNSIGVGATVKIAVDAGVDFNGNYTYNQPTGEIVERAQLNKTHLCGNAAINTGRSFTSSWYNSADNSCYMKPAN